MMRDARAIGKARWAATGRTRAEFDHDQGHAEVHFAALKPALTGEPFAGRAFVCCEQGQDPNQSAAELTTMLRTERHKLVHFLGFDDGQLFDLAEDPGGRRNLWGEPAAAAIKGELLDQLYRWRRTSAHQTRDWAADFR